MIEFSGKDLIRSVQDFADQKKSSSFSPAGSTTEWRRANCRFGGVSTEWLVVTIGTTVKSIMPSRKGRVIRSQHFLIRDVVIAFGMSYPDSKHLRCVMVFCVLTWELT